MKFIFETSVGISSNYRFVFDVNLNDTGTINKKAENKQDNVRVNKIVDFCTRSLPNGTPACDNQLRDGINKVCESNNKLDACHDGRVDQYYKKPNKTTRTKSIPWISHTCEYDASAISPSSRRTCQKLCY